MKPTVADVLQQIEAQSPEAVAKREQDAKEADKLNIKLSGYSPNTFDESFADDWLKKADKTANRASFKELQIDETKEFFEKVYCSICSWSKSINHIIFIFLFSMIYIYITPF